MPQVVKPYRWETTRFHGTRKRAGDPVGVNEAPELIAEHQIMASVP